MKKFLPLLASILLAGCYPSLDDVRNMETACKSQNGEVKREMFASGSNRIRRVYCIVDGAEYQVHSSGKIW